jgi:hypothetical protein
VDPGQGPPSDEPPPADDALPPERTSETGGRLDQLGAAAVVGVGLLFVYLGRNRLFQSTPHRPNDSVAAAWIELVAFSFYGLTPKAARGWSTPAQCRAVRDRMRELWPGMPPEVRAFHLQLPRTRNTLFGLWKHANANDRARWAAYARGLFPNDATYARSQQPATPAATEPASAPTSMPPVEESWTEFTRAVDGAIRQPQGVPAYAVDRRSSVPRTTRPPAKSRHPAVPTPLAGAIPIMQAATAQNYAIQRAINNGTW